MVLYEQKETISVCRDKGAICPGPYPKGFPSKTSFPSAFRTHGKFLKNCWRFSSFKNFPKIPQASFNLSGIR